MTLVELQRALRQLRCSGMASGLEGRLLQAQAEKLPPIDFLSTLVQDELLKRQDRLLERRLKHAGFRDAGKTLDTFDFDFNKKMNRALVFELATGRSVFIQGPPGAGKTTLATEFVRQVHTRFPEVRIARGRCLQTFGSADPYLPFVDALRDLSDEGTLAHVANQVGDLTTLRLLDALTEADSIATGTAAWGSWKQELVGVLVARVAHIISGGEVEEATGDAFPTVAQRDLMDQRRRIIEGIDDQLVVVSPDRPGLFSRVAGVLSLR